MITTKEVKIQDCVFDKFICDKCGREFSNDTIEDEIELQETHSIRFTGGYGSVFGDMVNVECDLCQNCLKELIGDFCRYE